MVGRLRTVLTNFGVTGVIETLEGWLTMLFTLARDFLADRLHRSILRRARCILLRLVLSYYLFEKFLHLVFSRVVRAAEA